MIVLPSRASDVIRVLKASAALASRPLSGSSKKIAFGLWRSAAAMTTRCRMPFEYAASNSPWSVASSSPKTSAVPALGGSMPVSIFTVVDLPAPLGPRSPTSCPVGISRSRPRTASTLPKRLESWRRRITRPPPREARGGSRLPDDRQPRRRPRPPAAVHRLRPRVAHLLERVGGERRAEAAAAVEHQVGVVVGHGLLDVPLDDALAEVARAGEVAAAPLLLLAYVDELYRGARGAHALDVGDGDLADAPPGIGDQREEGRRVLHQSSSDPFVPTKRSSASANKTLNVVRLP